MPDVYGPGVRLWPHQLLHGQVQPWRPKGELFIIVQAVDFSILSVQFFSTYFVQVLYEYKFEFLRIICSHEHFISLNLPVLRGTTTRGTSKRLKGRIMLKSAFQFRLCFYWPLLCRIALSPRKASQLPICAINMTFLSFWDHSAPLGPCRTLT